MIGMKFERGKLYSHFDLKALNSWRIGGRAERFYCPLDLDDLCRFLATCPPQEPIFFLGLGSNCLIRDGGLKGTVILTLGSLDRLEMLDDITLFAGAGLSCAQVARYSARQSLTGGEFLAGVPGTMGGALFMNAGAYGSETWKWVQKVQCVNRAGQLSWADASEFKVSYRCIEGLGDRWFVGAVLKFAKDPHHAGLEKIKKMLNHRAETQPTSEPSCGSVFRNPPNDYAGRLIEKAGFKGFSIGGAQVSPKHANFIVNTGNASSQDVETLIHLLQETILKQFNVHLEPEVKMIGDAT
jgi:UDP-N-acetylmuramate dehydrogenase